MSEMCCTRLAENSGHKNYAKNHHLRTIAQIFRAIGLYETLFHQTLVAHDNSNKVLN